jgi:hypothetical protein
MAQGATEPAIDAHRLGNNLAVRLANDYPDVVEDQYAAAFSSFSLAGAMLAAGDVASADAAYRACLTRWRAMPREMKRVPSLTLMFDLATVHPGSIVLEGEPDAAAAIASAMRSVMGPAPLGKDTPLERFTHLPLLKSYTDALVKLDPTNKSLKPKDYWRGFDRFIQALSADELTAAGRLLQKATESETAAQQNVKDVYGDAPIARFHVHSVQYLLGHARALEQLARRIKDRGE